MTQLAPEVERPSGPRRLRWGRRSPVAMRLRRLVYGDAPVAPLTTPVVTTFWVMTAISVLAVWFVLYVLVLSGLQQSRNNSVLYAQLREGLAGATTPIGGVITPGTPIAVLDGPSVGLSNSVIVEGTAPQDLRNGPGHRRDTPLPGQVGVSVLFGRSLTYGAPFKHLDQLKPGQRFSVTTGQGSFNYTVDRVRRAGDPLPTPLPAGGSRLLLETSAGSALAPSHTLFVDATLRGKSVDAPPGRLFGVPPSELAMGSDTSGLIKLVLWIQALIVVAIVLVWARSRWGASQAWLIGLPLVVAVLWGATGNVMMLLPNLI